MDKRVTQLPEDELEDRSFNGYPVLSPTVSNRSPGTNITNWSFWDSFDPAELSDEEPLRFSDKVFFAEINLMMKEHTDSVLRGIECISARVSQLESRTRNMEDSIDDLLDTTEFNHGSTEEKLRELQRIVKEVQCGIRDWRDKQDIAEAKLNIVKLQMSSADLQAKKQNSTVQIDSAQEASSVPLSNQSLPVPVASPPQIPVLSCNGLQNLFLEKHSPTPIASWPLLSTQLPQNFVPFAPHPSLVLNAKLQQYRTALASQWQHLRARQPVSVTPQFQLPPTFSTVNPQVQQLLSHYGAAPGIPSQILHQSSQPPVRTPDPQQFYGDPTHWLPGQFSSKPYSEFPSGFSQQPRHSNSGDPYPYIALKSDYNTSSVKSLPVPPSHSVTGGGSNYSGLPTAQVLPLALPTASPVDGGTSSGGGGNRAPVDDVIDKIVAMGFRRDLVKTTVMKLTENGQSVDLNVVLDKLMNDGEA